jgi:hypothetical protein
MPLKDILHRRSRDSGDPPSSPQAFTFIRTDTHNQEIISPTLANDEQEPQTPRRKSFFRRRSRASSDAPPSPGLRDEKENRHSNFLHLDHHHRPHSRSGSPSSVNIPADLPQIENDTGGDEQDRQAQWENRATRLVQGNPRLGASPDRTRPSTSTSGSYLQAGGGRSRSNSGVSEPQADVCLQYPLFFWVVLISARSIYKKQSVFMRVEVSSNHVTLICAVTDFLHRTREINPVIWRPRRPRGRQQRPSPGPLRACITVISTPDSFITTN